MDTRPLITPRMQVENTREWDRLWRLNKTEECPVCHEKPDIWDGPMNSGVPTRCTHWACVSCWERIARRDKRCPICRDDLTDWFASWRSQEDEDEEDEDEENEEMTEQEDSDDDEMGEVDPDMTQSDEPPELARVSFCEACERQLPGVVWFLEPFQNPSDNRRLYSACPTCRNRLGLRGAP
jgi:hypothetical protein